MLVLYLLVVLVQYLRPQESGFLKEERFRDLVIRCLQSQNLVFQESDFLADQRLLLLTLIQGLAVHLPDSLPQNHPLAVELAQGLDLLK